LLARLKLITDDGRPSMLLDKAASNPLAYHAGMATFGEAGVSEK
jgi:hypothetical protein